MYTEERLEFVDSLTLPSVSSIRVPRAYSSEAAVIDPTQDRASVAPSTINLFQGGVSEQNQADVEQSKLLMQLAADKAFPEENQLFEWYRFYTQGLAKLGWVISGKQMDNYTINKKALTIDAVAIELFTSLAGANAAAFAALAQKATGALQNNEGKIQIFERNKKLGLTQKFDVSPCAQTAEGSPWMILNCISVDIQQTTTGILFWKSTSDSTKVKAGAQIVTLNRQVYGIVRDKVLAKLGKIAEDSIDNLEI